MSRADWLLRRSPFQLTSSWINADRVSVLAYHGIDDPDNFAAQMDLIVRNFRPISIEDLDRAIHGGDSLPKRAVLVTFDDGHSSVLDHAAPILSDRGIPGVAFVIPGLLSSTRDFWWSEVSEAMSRGAMLAGMEHLDSSAVVRHLKTIDNEERVAAVESLKAALNGEVPTRRQLDDRELKTLEDAGIAIGNHTWSHPCLNRCQPKTIEEEIQSAHMKLEAVLGSPPRWFAYPNGDWAPHAHEVLSGLGYRLGFLFDHRLTGSNSEPLMVSRLRVNSDTPPDRFSIILSGLHSSIHHLRGRN